LVDRCLSCWPLYCRLEEFEDTEGVIRIRKSKDRQNNGQKKKYKRTNNDLQNITHKTKDRVTRTPEPLQTCELRCCGSVSSPCSTSDKTYETANVEKWHILMTEIYPENKCVLVSSGVICPCLLRINLHLFRQFKKMKIYSNHSTVPHLK